MRWQRLLAACVFLAFASSSVLSCKARRSKSGAKSDGPDDYGADAEGLSREARIGKAVWYNSIAGNERFHTYVAQQKIGVPQDWYRVLNSAERDSRFDNWGIINDPTPGCEAGGEEFFGFDKCPGDDALMASLKNKTKYVDPACTVSGTFNATDCFLGFGTSTGALGYRKFPNPRFDAAAWQALGGGSQPFTNGKFSPRNGGIEPPFLIGTSCGSCHISFNPLNPPANVNKPEWANIKGLVGAQYGSLTQIVGSGAAAGSIEAELTNNTRPGVTDTSAHTGDLVHNPGTPNAIFNLAKRPTFNKTMNDGSTQNVLGILKGGEDDAGNVGAIVRVFINIGVCSEECLMNHLQDGRSITGRGSFQTPFDVNQCRQDCPAYGALENQVDNVIKFFSSKAGHSTDLVDAVGGKEAMEAKVGGADLIAKGKRLFVQEECASCHTSSKPAPGSGVRYDADFLNQIDFTAKDADGVRQDWLSNEERTPQQKVGTTRCRSLHSNHMAGHVWDQYASKTYKESPDPSVPGLDPVPELDQSKGGEKGGGRGYYRNFSLLGVWSTAPLLHNNAVGPELCPGNAIKHSFRGCLPINNEMVSVDGRLKLFEQSMDELLTPPADRIKKITVTSSSVDMDLGPKIPRAFLPGGADSTELAGLKISLPAGTAISSFASLDHRTLVKNLATKFAGMNAQQRKATFDEIVKKGGSLAAKNLLEDPANSNCSGKDDRATEPKIGNNSRTNGWIENAGHDFGTGLDPEDKRALIAFLKTL